MRSMENETIECYLKRYKQERGTFQLIDSEFQIDYFWQTHCKLEETFIIDSIFLRTVEWGNLGLFNDWVERYCNSLYRNILSNGIGKQDAILLLFSLCRSNLAVKEMNLSLNQNLDALLCIDRKCDSPWQYYDLIESDTGKKLEKITNLSLAATIIFAHHQLNRDIDHNLSEKIGSLLVRSQLKDGSWPFEDNFTQGSFESTCMVLTAIYILKPRGWEYAVEKGKKWLLKNQSHEGFWYGSHISTYLTVLVLDTIHLIEGQDDLTYQYKFQIIGSPQKNREIKINEHLFKISFSFAGEYRKKIEPIVDALEMRYGKNTIFYDNYYQSLLAQIDLDLLLQDIYLKRSDLVVVFFCSEYADKNWCGIEWRALRSFIFKKEKSKLMLIKIGEGNVEGIFDIDGILDIRNMSVNQIVDSICLRYNSEFK